MALFVCCLFIAGCGSNSDSSNSSSNSSSSERDYQSMNFLVGDHVVVRTEVMAAARRSDYDLLNQYAAARNSDAMLNMRIQGKVVVLFKDDIAEVRQVEVGTIKILMLSGPYKGKELYVIREGLEKGARANAVIAEANRVKELIAVKNNTVEDLMKYLKRQGFKTYPDQIGKGGQKTREAYIPGVDEYHYVVETTIEYTGRQIDSYSMSVVLGNTVKLDHPRMKYLYETLSKAYGEEFSDAIKIEVNTTFASVNNKKIKDTVEFKRTIGDKKATVWVQDTFDGVILTAMVD